MLRPINVLDNKPEGSFRMVDRSFCFIGNEHKKKLLTSMFISAAGGCGPGYPLLSCPLATFRL